MIIRKVLLTITVLIIFIFGLFIFSNKEILKQRTIENLENVVFFPYMSSINSNVRGIDVYNLYFVVQKGEKNPLEDIVSISLGDIDEIQVTDFKIIEGEEARDYKLYTLGLDIDYLTAGEYFFSYISITTKKASNTFEIGEWYVHIDDLMEMSFIESGVPYPILNMNFNEYRYALKNTSDDTIIVDKIVNNIVGKNLNEQIKSNSTLQGTYKIDIIQEYPEYNFFYIKPKFIYNIDSKEYSFYPKGTIFFTEIIDELIDKIVNNNNSGVIGM